MLPLRRNMIGPLIGSWLRLPEWTDRPFFKGF